MIDHATETTCQYGMHYDENSKCHACDCRGTTDRPFEWVNPEGISDEYCTDTAL